MEQPRFGTSGLRGLNAALSDDLVSRYAKAFLRGTPAGTEVLIGQDLRPSSPRIARAVAGAAGALGLGLRNCGALPTPALALEAMARRAPAIMVTGSHIPADRNGLKFYSPDGEITKAEEARITGCVSAESAAAPLPLPAVDERARQHFTDRYTRAFPGQPLTGQRIGVYQHSSVARDLICVLLEALGAAPVPLARSDRFVPVDTEAVDPATRDLFALWVREHGLDAIVSTDGDADRPMLADTSGRLVPGDLMGPVTARLLGAEVVVTPVSSNSCVERLGAFSKVVRCRIGSPYVLAAMAGQRDARTVGYEANGGFLLGFDARPDGAALSALPTRDFALPILATLISGARAGGLSALLKALPARFTATNRLQGIAPEVSARLVERVLAADPVLVAPDLGPVRARDTTDGARLTFADGRVLHVRPSGNAPELRVYVETDSTATAEAVLGDMLARLARAAE